MDAVPRPGQSDVATIFCCVERGRLESQTLLMLETLRCRGGPLGQSRILVMIPRRGAPLTKATRDGLDALGAEVHDASRFNRMSWFNWYGKVAAAVLAEEIATTPIMIWLDSDILVLKPIVELGLDEGVDFMARREWLPPAVFSDADVHVRYWRKACEAVGVRWDDVPWLPADGPDRAQRLAINAGIYAFRRGRGLAAAYAEATDRIMRARLACHDGNFWVSDQVALPLAALRLGLRFRELSRLENHMIFQGLIDGPGAAPQVPEARIIHYSESMYPEYWTRFMARLEAEQAELARWLHPRGPIGRAKIPGNPASLARKALRNLQFRLFARRCVRVS